MNTIISGVLISGAARLALGSTLRTAAVTTIEYGVVPLTVGIASLTLAGIRKVYSLLIVRKPNPTVTKLVESAGIPANDNDWVHLDHPSKGLRPIAMPTLADIRRAQVDAGYRNDTFHLAVAGAAGTGKSSLINAFRGIPNSHQDAAPTGIVETTLKITRYSDQNAEGVRETISWYDVPGGGTKNVPGWQYFNSMGLYIFDAIIVAVGDRLTEIDVEILRNSERYLIPTFIVRTKADTHIANMMLDSPVEHNDTANLQKQFVEQTQHNITQSLESAGLPAQRVYGVSNRTLREMYCAIRDGKYPPKDCIDEEALMGDLFLTAYDRRCSEE